MELKTKLWLRNISSFLLALLMASCGDLSEQGEENNVEHSLTGSSHQLTSLKTKDFDERDQKLSEKAYKQKFRGFLHGLSFANYTGLITETDKNNPPFYTREDWGKPDRIKRWGRWFSDKIQFWVQKGKTYRSDDDSAIELLYLRKTYESPNLILTPDQIRQTWIEWVDPFWVWFSNKNAYRMMKQGARPPLTTNSASDQRIDAQLTTEIFGLLALGNPSLAYDMADLPILTTAKGGAAAIAHFYVKMHALAGTTGVDMMALAEQSKDTLTGTYAESMYRFVKNQRVSSDVTWEQARDRIYERYQRTGGADGYVFNPDHGEIDAGINFACSLVSLFWGQGDFLETIKIGSLCGWDSDNPTATWGGMLGFIYGETEVVQLIKRAKPSNYRGWELPNHFNIGATTRIESHWHLDEISQWAWDIYVRAIESSSLVSLHD